MVVPSVAPSPLLSQSPSVTPINCDGLSREEALQQLLLRITTEDRLLNSTTPQGRALTFLIADVSLEPCTYPTLDQRFALATLYYATQGEEWIDSTGWLVEKDECSWAKVTCNSNFQVANLTLGNNELNGTLPEEIRALQALEVLDVSANYLTGTIPAGLDGLPSSLTRFHCARNQIGGSIPDAIGNLTSLKELVVRCCCLFMESYSQNFDRLTKRVLCVGSILLFFDLGRGFI